jgi:hypothetical protein
MLLIPTENRNPIKVKNKILFKMYSFIEKLLIILSKKGAMNGKIIDKVIKLKIIPKIP